MEEKYLTGREYLLKLEEAVTSGKTGEFPGVLNRKGMREEPSIRTRFEFRWDKVRQIIFENNFLRENSINRLRTQKITVRAYEA